MAVVFLDLKLADEYPEAVKLFMAKVNPKTKYIGADIISCSFAWRGFEANEPAIASLRISNGKPYFGIKKVKRAFLW